MSTQHTEAVVVGGGLTGVAAAIASARNDAKTLLIEQYGFLGGMATCGLVNPFALGYYVGKEQIIEGTFQDILGNLKELGGLGENGRTFDEEIMKFVLDEMIKEAKVKVLFHTLATDVSVKGSKIETISTESKSGRNKIAGKVFIDATGDGDIAARAGVPFESGRKKDGLTQPMTLCFRMAEVDAEKMPSRKEITKLYKSAKKRGEITNPREDVLYFKTVHQGIVHFNTTRVVRVDGTKVEDLTYAEIEGRRQVMEMVNFLRKNIPGFERSYLLMTAPQIGVRETRRIAGEYILTEQDVLEARKFKDGIARGSRCIDIHSPTGEGTIMKNLKPGTSYDIPYRCLVPKKIDNLLVAGRCISATHEACSSIRVMPICTAIGEAAGVAGAQSIKEGYRPFRKLNVRTIQKRLISQGANLGKEKEKD